MKNVLKKRIGMFHWANVQINALINKTTMPNLINVNPSKSRQSHVIILSLYGILRLTHANYVLKKLLYGMRQSRFVSNVLLNIQYLIILLVNVWRKIVHLDRNGILSRLNARPSRRNVQNMKITHFSNRNVLKSVKFTRYIIKHQIVVHM